MAKSVLVRVSLVRAALLGAFALFGTPFTIGEAAGKVAVASATDGDPHGKPPQEAERVLRIGIDVQANELVTTNESDRAHLAFLDGSSLTVGPNAHLTIDRRAGHQRQQGVLRPVGGKISKGNPITRMFGASLRAAALFGDVRRSALPRNSLCQQQQQHFQHSRRSRGATQTGRWSSVAPSWGKAPDPSSRPASSACGVLRWGSVLRGEALTIGNRLATYRRFVSTAAASGLPRQRRCRRWPAGRYLSLIPFYGVDLVSLLNHQPPAFIAEADAVVAFKLNPPTLHGATSL